MQPRSLGHRAPLLWVVLPLIAGLLIGRIIGVGHIGWLLSGAGAGACVSAYAAWSARPAWVWGAGLLFALACAGVVSYGLQQQRLERWEALPPRELRLSLRIDRLFAPADPAKVSGLARIVGVDTAFHELDRQKVYFSCTLRPGEAAPRRSAIVRVRGVLAPLPSAPAPQSFDGYLASSGVNFRFTRAKVLHEERPQLAYYRFCDAAERRFKAILGAGIAEKRPTLTGLLRAMMLGETRELTNEQHTIFMQSGTMHLFAISGLNIAVIAGAIEAILLLARLRPGLRFLAGTPLLWLFVDITGAAPSAVRAFAMAVFFQGAFVARRPANPLAALIGSAAVVLIVAPLQLFSASFLMSYSIVLALLVLGLPLSDTWCAAVRPWRDVPVATWTRPQRAVAWILNHTTLAVAIGVATTLVSVITSVEFFQLLTPGALIANLVLIPAAAGVTLGGFLSLVCGLLGFGAGAVLFNHASALILWVIEALVRGSVRVPGAFQEAQFRAPFVGGTTLALLTAVLLFGYATGWRRERGGWWPPFILVALTLALGVRFG